MALAGRAAATILPVHIRGESGTGKERLARWIHESSPRGHGPFVAVNCAALSRSLLEAELFGAVRGAYTGAERDRAGLFRHADGGTLFLDEIGDMPPAVQAALLRALQDGRVRPVGGEREERVDVRVLSATHRDVRRMCREGAFREDLYYRLAIVGIRLPPLRERPDDLPELVAALAPRLADETGLPAPRLAPCALRLLMCSRWPGNVRQLHGVLARAMLAADGMTITAEHLDPLESAGTDTARPSALSLERAMIDDAVRGARGNLSEAARRIGWSRQKLYRRLRATGGPSLRQSSPAATTSSNNSTFQ